MSENKTKLAKDGPTPYQRKIMWKAATGVALLVLGVLLVGLVWMTSNVLSFLQPVLLPVAIAGIIAYLLDPVVKWFMNGGMSRIKSVLTVFSSFLVVLIIMTMIIIPPITEQLGNEEKRQNLGKNMRNTIENLGDTAWIKSPADWALSRYEKPVTANPPAPEELKTTADGKVPFSETNLANLLKENTDKIFGFITSSASSILGTLGYLVGLAMVPIYLYYFLKESSAIKSNWQDYVPLKASQFKTEVIETLREINGYLISFFRGQVLVAMIDGFLIGIALWIFGLPYGVLIGIILGIIGIIPFIGNIICLIPACLIAFVHFSAPENISSHEWLLGNNPWVYVGAVAAIFIVVQQINSLVTTPKIVGKSVGLHPMTVIFSMLFWALILGGFLGTLLAVPMTAAVKVLFRRYIWEHKINNKPLIFDDVDKIHDIGNGDSEKISESSAT